MIQYFIWAISFVGLWLTLVWLNVLFTEKPKRQGNIAKLPSITIHMPFFNRERFLRKTITSLAQLNYPKQLLEILLINDGSTDNSLKIAKQLAKEFSDKNIKIISHQKNMGKANAMNTALKHAKGELFACIDSDTRVHADSLRHLVKHFRNQNLGGVIGLSIVDQPKNFFEKLQRVEYTLTNLIRRLMSSIGTLFVTPGGAFPIYKTKIIRKLGGFEESGMTEDLEIAMRLKSHGYDVVQEIMSKMYTSVPKTFRALWRQRVRWYRGNILTHWKYRRLFFSRKHGLFGTFQLPINVLTIILLLTTILIASYGLIKDLSEFVIRSITIKGYFITNLLDFPSIKELLLGHNIQITLPIFIGTILAIYLFTVAHRFIGERMFKHLHYVGLYFLIVPYLTAAHWISSIVEETFRLKRKW